VILDWRKTLRFDLDRWPILVQYAERVAALPAVRAAMTAEGLLGQAEPEATPLRLSAKRRRGNRPRADRVYSSSALHWHVIGGFA
jgi:hypothetical protein